MASRPAVGGNDGTRERQRFTESKVYTRKAFKGPKKKVADSITDSAAAVKPATTTAAAENDITTATTASTDNNITASTTAATENSNSKNENITTTAAVSAQNITENIDATNKEVSFNTNNNHSNSNSPQPEPRERQQLQTISAKDVNSAAEAGSEQEPVLKTLSAEDVNLATEAEQEPKLQTQAAEDDGNLGTLPEQEPTLQTQAAEDDGNLATLPEQEPQLQILSAEEDVNSAPEAGSEKEPQLKTLSAEDVNLTTEPDQEPQLQTQAAEDGNLATLPEQELEPQLQILAGEDVSSVAEQGLEQQPQLTVEDVNSTPAPGPEQEPQLQTQATEDVNMVQQQELQQPVSPSDMVADDSSSLNRQQVPAPSAQEPVNGSVKQGFEGRVKLNLGSGSGSRSQSKQDLRRKLEMELDKVRKLVKRIEAKEGDIGGGFSRSHASANELVNNGANRVHSEVASAGVNWEITRPKNHLSVSVMENGQGLMSDSVEKEKRTPKANPYYRNSEFLLAKDKFPPAESNKKSKLNGKKHGVSELGNGFGMAPKFVKSCSSLLDKLMKHKHGWVFNTPVDAEALGLHDYHIIIKHPMDLGTVKLRLNKNWYKSPKEFAEDVRLTFHNAMTYNPEGQDVHVMAEQLSKIFEDRWAIIESDYNREMRFHQDYEASLPTPTSRYAPLPLPLSLTRPSPLDMRRIIDRSESMSHSFDPKLKPTSTTPSSRTPAPKKPKAKDLNKRDMTYEEKQKLSTNLQSLPPEKLDNIVQIIRKRNSAVLQHDDEIEVDIDRVDAETLWELDRFVTNYKKGLSKNKRKAELAIQARGSAAQNVQEKNPPSAVAPPPKEIRTDERNASASSPVQGAKEGDNASGSSSSSSSSSDSGSSSSDSDSDSSSASGSDAEHSPRA